MKAVATAAAEISQETITEFEKNGHYILNLDGAGAVIETADAEVLNEDIPGWLVTNGGKLAVALEITITEELRCEGIARELANRTQNICRLGGSEATNKVKITLFRNPQTDNAVNEYDSYIRNQASDASPTLTGEVKGGTELNFDDFSLFVNIVKK